MRILPFTLAFSILVHVLILAGYTKKNNIDRYSNMALSSVNPIEISIIQSAKDGSSTAKDTTGSNKESQKQIVSEENKQQEKSVIGKKKRKEKKQKSIAKSGTTGQDGYGKNNFSQGYASYIPRPEYPIVSRRNKEEGTVIFDIYISSLGDLIKYKIKKSSGYKRLDKMAEKSVKMAKFQPALDNGKPVDSNLELKITFSLEDK